jgi:hypothetical protein
VLILPVLVFAVLAARGRAHKLAAAGLVVLNFAIPVLVYMTYSAVMLQDGFQLSDQGDAVLYGRVAAAADCATLRIPAVERPLCPSPAAVATLGIDGLVNQPTSPIYTYEPQTGVDRSTLAKRFSYSVIEQQPLRVAGAIARDAVKVFAFTRDTSPGDTPVWRWQFQTSYQTFPPTITRASAADLIESTGGGGAPKAVGPWTNILRDYQLHGGYTPGPLLLLALLAGLGGAVAGRRRARSAALACLMLTGTGVVVLFGADMYEFSWRYQLPALVTLPAAGALGAALVAARVRRRPRPQVTLLKCQATAINRTSAPSNPGSCTRTAGSG